MKEKNNMYTVIYQIIEDISLMHVDGDEGLVLNPLHLAQVLRRHGDERVEHLEEVGVGGSHDLLVAPRGLQSHLGVPGPYHLYPQEANLGREGLQEVHEAEGGGLDGVVGLGDDRVQGQLGLLEQDPKPRLHVPLRQDAGLQFYPLPFLGLHGQDGIVLLIVEHHGLHVVKHAE